MSNFWLKTAGEAIGSAVICGLVSGFIFKVLGDLISASLPQAFVWGAMAVSAGIGGLFSIMDIFKRRKLYLIATHFERGNEAYGKQEYDLAIDCYSQAIRFRPKFAEAYFNQAVARKMKGEYDSAIKDHSEAIRLRPDFALGFYNRGLTYGRKGDYDLELADINEAIRLNPKDPDYYRDRGICYACKQDFDNAIADFTKALRLVPSEPTILRLRAWAYWEKQQNREAIADLTEAVRDATFADAANFLAWLLATCPEDDLRDGRTAVELARKACEVTNWKDANYLGTLAAANAECGEFKEAVEWQKKAIELYPKQKQVEKGQERLRFYEEEKPWRVSGPDDATEPLKR